MNFLISKEMRKLKYLMAMGLGVISFVLQESIFFCRFHFIECLQIIRIKLNTTKCWYKIISQMHCTYFLFCIPRVFAHKTKWQSKFEKWFLEMAIWPLMRSRNFVVVYCIRSKMRIIFQRNKVFSAPDGAKELSKSKCRIEITTHIHTYLTFDAKERKKKVGL